MTQDLNQFNSSLLKALQKEVLSAKTLFQSLLSEREALSTLDEKLITINSARKHKLIEGLQQASNARIAILQDNGYKITANTIAEFISSELCNSELKAQFTLLEDISQQCFHENRLIGQLINRRAQFITQALSSISSPSNPQDLTYAKNGSTKKQDSLRNLGTI